MHKEAEAGRNLGHSFAAASFGADDSLALDCEEEEAEAEEEEEEEPELKPIAFHISVNKGGKVSSGGTSYISAGSNRTSTGKRRQSSASTTTTTTSRRMAHNGARTSAGTTLKLTSKAGFDSATAPTISSTEKIKGGPSSVVKAPRVRKRPLKQQNTNITVHANDNVSIGAAANGTRSRSSGSSSSSTQQTSRRRSGGNGRKVPTPEKSKLRRKSPRKAAAAASQGSVTATGLQD